MLFLCTTVLTERITSSVSSIARTGSKRCTTGPPPLDISPHTGVFRLDVTACRRSNGDLSGWETCQGLILALSRWYQLESISPGAPQQVRFHPSLEVSSLAGGPSESSCPLQALYKVLTQLSCSLVPIREWSQTHTAFGLYIKACCFVPWVPWTFNS